MISNKHVFAANIDNSVNPVSYFVNHVKQLKEVKTNLQKYRKTSLAGFSGVGKTQIARMYTYDNHAKYNVIWFFDCNSDLHNQFQTLAKSINEQEGRAIFNEDGLNIKKDLISYFTNKKDWLFVFDNLLMGQNYKVREFIKWENNGHIIFCSQDKEILPHIIGAIKFTKLDSYNLATSILADNKQQFAKFITSTFKDQPGLIVLASQIVNNFHGLSLEQYKKLIIRDANYVENTLRLAQNQLSPKALRVLNMVSLINNQSCSKAILNLVNGADVSDELIELSKLMLITYLEGKDINNPTYEMHDIFSSKIKKINGEKRNKAILKNIIDNVTYKLSGSRSMLEEFIMFSSNTFQSNIEAILRNAEFHELSLNKVMQIHQILLGNYISSHNYYSAEQMVAWFLQKEGDLSVEAMHKKEKEIYVDYLQCIGGYYRLSLSDHKNAVKYFLKSLDLINKHQQGGMYFSLLYQLAQSHISIGSINAAKENINNMELLLKSIKNNDIGLLYLVKGRLLYFQGKYSEALVQINKDISESIKHGLQPNDLLFSSTYILKLEILNALKQNLEARKQAEQLLEMNKLKDAQHNIFAKVYTQMAITELNDNNIFKAKEHIESVMSINDTSTGRDLSITYTTAGDVALLSKEPKVAIDFYLKSLDIYINLYGKRKHNVLEVSNLYTKGAMASCAIEDKHYNVFAKLQVDDFGIDHPNTKKMLDYCKPYNNPDLLEYRIVPNS